MLGNSLVVPMLQIGYVVWQTDGVAGVRTWPLSCHMVSTIGENSAFFIARDRVLKHGFLEIAKSSFHMRNLQRGGNVLWFYRRACCFWDGDIITRLTLWYLSRWGAYSRWGYDINQAELQSLTVIPPAAWAVRGYLLCHFSVYYYPAEIVNLGWCNQIQISPSI